MQLDEAREKFIQAWGALGSHWGINRTMAQVHALLLISPESLCAEDIMSILKISRGNANMNLRALIDWGLVSKEHKTGERREYFSAEKDIWQVAKQVTIERRKRELKPVLKVLSEVKQVEGDEEDKHIESFREAVENLEGIVLQADKFLELFVDSESNWFFSSILKAIAHKSKQQ